MVRSPEEDLRVQQADYPALLAGELDRLTARLRELGAEKIILFGSYAKGRADLLTDLDLIVVMASDLPFIERTGRLYQDLSPRVSADILVYTPAEWELMRERPFIQNALGEGRVLHEADSR